MAIDPLILLPAAAAAVLIVILFIRLVAGARNALLTPDSLAAFLADQQPGEKIAGSVISRDRKFALIRWRDGVGIGLVRSFGDKLVLQMLETDMQEKCEWRADGTVFYIPRQGFAFPPVKFAVNAEEHQALENILNGGRDAAA